METAIKRAIDGGYKDHSYCNEFDMYECSSSYCHSTVLLDPNFWKALGKAEGWGQKISKGEHEWGKQICLHCGVDTAYQPPKESGCNHAHFPEACEVCSKKSITWKQQWHRFIDHLAAGKPVDDFFNSFLKK